MWISVSLLFCSFCWRMFLHVAINCFPCVLCSLDFLPFSVSVLLLVAYLLGCSSDAPANQARLMSFRPQIESTLKSSIAAITNFRATIDNLIKERNFAKILELLRNKTAQKTALIPLLLRDSCLKLFQEGFFHAALAIWDKFRFIVFPFRFLSFSCIYFSLGIPASSHLFSLFLISIFCVFVSFPMLAFHFSVLSSSLWPSPSLRSVCCL